MKGIKPEGACILGKLPWRAFLTLLVLFVASLAHAYTEQDICTKRESLCRSLLEKGLTNEDLGSLFGDPRVTLYPEILERRGKGLNYFSKKFGLLTPKSVEKGRALLIANRSLFADIESRYHVSPSALVAIYRVETNFGQYVGTYPVFNSLLTLTLIENRRSDWAEKELVHLVALARADNADPLSIKGSWAGAFGLCQFIPSSYLNYGADGDNDGKIDLFQFKDAMASIANYLAGHGWITDDTKKMRQAIYAYNHCDNYVKAVLAYAKAIEAPPGKKAKKQAPSRKKKRPSRT